MHAEKIRQVAILVASLDKTVAQQLLSELSRHEAAAVAPRNRAPRRRRSRRTGSGACRIPAQPPTAGCASRNAQRDRRRGGFLTCRCRRSGGRQRRAGPCACRVSGNSLSRVLAGIEADALADLLRPEHPQVIAVALSRMGYDQAATVFAAFPEELQQEVLPRVSNLQSVDDEAMAALEAQLRPVDHAPTTAAASARRQRPELARQILAKTSPQQRAS